MHCVLNRSFDIQDATAAFEYKCKTGERIHNIFVSMLSKHYNHGEILAKFFLERVTRTKT